MKLRDWRNLRSWSLERTAAELSIILGEDVQARTLHRYETGETQVTTQMAEAVRIMTDDAVQPNDFHEVKLGRMVMDGRLKPIERRSAA